MSEFAIEVEGGKSVRLPTAGKYCARDILVTAKAVDTEAIYQQGVADGKQAEYDRFWDAYQNNGEYEHWMHYAYAFAGRGWTDEVYNPKYPIVFGASYSAQHMFNSSRITDTKVPITVQDVTGTWISNPFANSSLETIRKFVIQTQTGLAIGQFTNCTVLKNIFIEGTIIGKKNSIDPNFQWSPLTVESMKNIISCLKDYSGTDEEYAYTVKFSDACWAALDAEGNTSPNGDTWKSYVQNKGWNI